MTGDDGLAMTIITQEMASRNYSPLWVFEQCCVRIEHIVRRDVRYGEMEYCN